MPKDNAHTVLVKKTLLKIGEHPELCRAWQNDTGAGYSTDFTRFIRYGCPGSPDILGIIKGGTLLAAEVKTGHGTQSTVQKKFQRMIETLGGLYVVVRKEEDAILAIKKRVAATTLTFDTLNKKDIE